MKSLKIVQITRKNTNEREYEDKKHKDLIFVKNEVFQELRICLTTEFELFQFSTFFKEIL